VHPKFAWLSDERIRLILLLALLASLVVYVATSPIDALSISNGPTVGAAAPENCPAGRAPSVETIRRTQLLGLREGLRRIMFFDKSLRPYEQGLVASSSAWSDSEPGTHKSLPLNPRDPGGYEMRWWMANGDDVGADVMVFASRRQARDFFMRASSTRCRPASAALAASFPPGGRNLKWRNPDGFAQEDVYLLRGRRVYRVAVVKAGAGGSITAAAQSAAFSLVNSLACALPDAACQRYSSPTLTAATGRKLLSCPSRAPTLASTGLADPVGDARRRVPKYVPEVTEFSRSQLNSSDA
jgi:hypothetical protein